MRKRRSRRLDSRELQDAHFATSLKSELNKIAVDDQTLFRWHDRMAHMREAERLDSENTKARGGFQLQGEHQQRRLGLFYAWLQDEVEIPFEFTGLAGLVLTGVGISLFHAIIVSHGVGAYGFELHRVGSWTVVAWGWHGL